MARSGESGRGRGGAARRRATRDAVAQASKITEAREAARSVGRTPRPRQPSDPFTGELRRRAVLPLLVLHLISQPEHRSRDKRTFISECLERNERRRFFA